MPRMERVPRDDSNSASSDSWGGETDWHLIGKVSGRDPDADPERAWLDLVERYRGPVQRSLMRRLRNAPAAEEAASDFFSYLFQKQVLPKADRDQGRFRCYIQGVIRLYAKQWKRASSVGGVHDVEALESAATAADNEAEREEELAWAKEVLSHAFDRLGRSALRDAEMLQRVYGLGGRTPISREQLARERSMTMNAMHVALHRARNNLKDSLNEELRSMTTSDTDLALEHEFLLGRLLEAYPGLF